MQLLSLLCCSAKGVGVIIEYNSVPKLMALLPCLLLMIQTWVTESQTGCCPNCKLLDPLRPLCVFHPSIWEADTVDSLLS